MKVKIFHLRLNKEHLDNDLNTLNSFIHDIIVKRISSEFVTGKVNFWSVFVLFEEPGSKARMKTGKIFYPADTILTEDENLAYLTLKQWRYDKSNELNIPSYMVCSNAELITIVKVLPQSSEELIKIKGFASHKVSKFGDDIIAVLNSI